MFATTKTVTLDNREVVCKDLTYGYIVDIESGVIPDTLGNAVINGTDLTEDEVNSLRKHEVEHLYNAIMQLTYPHLFDEDGNPKKLNEKESEDKKKD